MKNKTCVECRYMLHKDTFEVCTHSMTETSMFNKACKHFAPPTNGDRIRQMNNEELAEIISNVDCKICPACMTCFKEENETCFDGMLAWLNAPADCVAENGESAKQADLCCKSAKESEGKDE